MGNESKPLVVYFSATGTTARAARTIAEATGGTLREIAPRQAYTAADLDWNDRRSRSSVEMDNPAARPALKGGRLDIAAHDVIFIGYPIWWGVAAWPTNGFVAGNDFAGKTVVPFCTSISSPVGESATGLESLASGDAGTWAEGQRFDSGTSDDEVRTWVSSLAIG